MEIPATIDIDSGDRNGAENNDAENGSAENSGEKNTATARAERIASEVRKSPNQIEAMPLLEQISPESSFDTLLSEPEDELSSSSGEVTNDDVVEEADPEEML